MAYLRAWVNATGDGTWSGTTTEILRITNVSTSNNFGDSVPTATITCVKGTNIVEGNEIRIYNSTSHNIPNTPSMADCIFRGIVQSVNHEGLTTTINCNNWLQNLVNRVSQTYTLFEGQSYLEIFKYLCVEGFGNSRNSITYNNIMAYFGFVGLPNYVPINTIYSKLECKNQCIYETLISLCEGVDYWFYYDYTDFKIWFKPRQAAHSLTFHLKKPKTAAISGAIRLLEIPNWDSDVQNVASKATVIGGAWDEYISSKWSNGSSGHAPDWSWIGVNFRETNVHVDKDISSYAVYKVEILPTGATAWVELPTDNYYTKYDPDWSLSYIYVYLDSNKCYQYLNAITDCQVTLVRTVSEHPYTTPENTTSCHLYGSRDKIVTNQNIITPNDLITYATNLLAYWCKSSKNTTLRFRGSGNYLGYGVTIVDEFSGKTITYANYTDSTHWTGIITNMEVSYPNPITTVTVADHTIKNDSISALLNKTINSITNNYSNLKLGTALKTDGTKSVTNNIDITNKELINLVIENVESL